MGFNGKGVLHQHAWYDNDILGMAIRMFHRTGDVHNEILESALGIGQKIAQGDVKTAQALGVQLRVVMQNMMTDTYNQPPDAGQLSLMLFSRDYPQDVQEKIAKEAMGYSSLAEFRANLEGSVRGLEQLR